jgi:23S rRNA (cytosine1962-C5)-methyltransferase
MNHNSIPPLSLKPGREKSILRRHPWIFSGAIEQVDPKLQPGDTVAVYTSKQELVGYGAISPSSQIRCRLWVFAPDKDQYLTESKLMTTIIQRIEYSFLVRKGDKNLNNSNAYRLIHAESDRLPGLIADVYDNVVVLQFLSSGVDRYREQISNLIVKVTNAGIVYERSDAEVRVLEGLSKKKGMLYGDPFSEQLVITENGLQFYVDYVKGHKTGFYLDQRENRNKVRLYSKDKEVLDCFAYSGGFSLNALAGGAKHVTSVDISEEALNLLNENVKLNGFSGSSILTQQMDVFKQLRRYRDQGKKFDLIILDPPKFAPTRKQAQQAARGYKDINLIALKLLRPGGILFTFSCSGGVDQALFQKIIAGAALDADVNLQIIDRLTQASDHPILSSFPEGEYLKGLICRKQ